MAAVGVLCVGLASLGALASGNANAVDVDVVVLAASLFAPLAGAVLLDVRPREPLGWLLAAAGLAPPVLLATAGLDAGAVPDVARAAQDAPHLLVGVSSVAAVGVPLVLPAGWPVDRWGRVTGALAVAVGMTGLGAWLFQSGRQAAAVDASLGAVERACLWLVVPLAVSALARAAVCCRRATGSARNRLAWALLGSAALVAAGAGSTVLAQSALQTYVLAALLAVAPVGLVALQLLPVVRPVDGALLRLVLLLLVGAVLGGTYVLLDAGLARTGLPDPGSAAVVSTALAALALAPAYVVVRDAALVRLYGTARPGSAMVRLGRSVDAVGDVSDAMGAAAAAVAAAVRSPSAHVVLGEEEPTSAPGAAVLPLVAGQLRLGSLVVAPRREEEPFSRRDLELLSLLATPIAQLARSVVLTQELERARGDAVAQLLEERRRLRRDLHDSVGPLLAGLGLQADAVRRAHPEERGLDAVTRAVASCRKEVRRLVDGLEPDDVELVDLEAAVRELVEGWASAAVDTGLVFTVEVPAPLPPIGEQLRLAAYRVVGEALTNAVRHAQARHCTVRLTAHGDELLVEVCDDGRGPEPHGARRGVGLRSMRERTASLGGELEVTGGQVQGTAVRARLPLGAR